MAFKADWPDAKYGFWVTVGVIACLAFFHLISSLYRRAKGQ